MKKYVSQLEIKDKLAESINANEIALDNLRNWINRLSDSLEYKEDPVLREDLQTLKYIECTLLYVGDCYEKSYKQLGGKL